MSRPSEPWNDDDELITWWGLTIEGYRATQATMERRIAERFSLQPGFFEILLRLVRTPGLRLPMTQLAREASFTSGGLTKIADRMVTAGLIRREPCETDRRVIRAVLTEHGLDVAGRARQAGAEILREVVIGPLGPDRAAAMADTMRVLREANHPACQSSTTSETPA